MKTHWYVARAILFKGETRENPFLEFIASGGNLRSSAAATFTLR